MNNSNSCSNSAELCQSMYIYTLRLLKAMKKEQCYQFVDLENYLKYQNS